MTLAFRIIGTVHTDSIDEALRAVSAYADPDNMHAERSGDPSEHVAAIRFEWRAVDEDAELGTSYDSGDVARVLDSARELTG